MKNKERNIDCTSKKNKTRRVLLISFTIFVFVWIFAMSHKTARESETISQRIDQLICDLFVDGFDEFPAEEQQRMLTELDFWVRKSAHFFEYAVLGAVLYLTAGVIAEKNRCTYKDCFFLWDFCRRQQMRCISTSWKDEIRWRRMCSWMHREYVWGLYL